MLFMIMVKYKELLKVRLELLTGNKWDMFVLDRTLIFKNTINRKLFIVLHAHDEYGDVGLGVMDTANIDNLRPINDIVEKWYRECYSEYINLRNRKG